MIVVSDSSPLIALNRIGRMDLLGSVFGRVLVPEAVRAEFDVGADGLPLEAFPWLSIESVQHRERVTTFLAMNLGLGEAEAVVLAEERHAEYVLIDERVARATARRSGLRVMGLLGVLLLAKRQGVLDSVGPLIEALVEGAGFRADERLIAEVLQSAGE